MSNLEMRDSERLRLELKSELERAGKRGRPARYLYSHWSEQFDRKEIQRALDRLSEQGVAVFWNNRWLAIEARDDWEAGSFRAQRSGGGTVRGSEETYFVPENRSQGARDGDTVVVRPSGQKERKGRSRGMETASVVRVLTSAQVEMVGFLERRGESWALIPFDTRSRLDVTVVGDVQGAREGDYVVVELKGSGQGEEAEGRVVERIGPVEAAGVDTAVVLRHFGIPEEMPRAVIDEASRFPDDPPSSDFRGREDLRDLVTVTVDGASARDFDDAISVERLEDGFRLGVHIADVSHYVKEGSELDSEAVRRGNSVYYPERAIPMLPENLSNGLCSLRPGVPRLTVSAFLDIDLLGNVRRQRFSRSVIRSHRRLTYDEVRRLLEQGRPEDEGEYGEVLPLLLEARALMTCLYRARMARGSLDFDLPEGDVILDTDGVMVGIRPGERHAAHRIIEEFMIAANQAVARELEANDRPGIYRVHQPPDPERIEGLKEVLAPLGIELDHDPEDPSPWDLQEVIRHVEGHPEEGFVAQFILRTQQRAVYSPDCDGHYALAAEHYLHFTSPIRRYPDLVVHRSLTRLLENRAAEGDGEREIDLETLSDHLSQTERRAEHSERELLQWKKVRFLEKRVGERFTGRITGVQSFGLFVQLDDYFVDGLVPIASLGDEYFEYEEASHRLLGTRSGKVYRLADPVEVELEAVDARHRGLNLRMVHRLVERKKRTAREREGQERRGKESGDKRKGRRGRRNRKR